MSLARLPTKTNIYSYRYNLVLQLRPLRHLAELGACIRADRRLLLVRGMEHYRLVPCPPVRAGN